MAARRDSLPPEVHRALSEELERRLLAILAPQPPAMIGFCWPIRNEPDVEIALDHWRRAGIRTALPVVVDAEAPLEFATWQPGEPLVQDRYGIPTPAAGVRGIPDTLIVPLNAFDSDGFRLGYGGGYFDRTLASLSPRPLAVGVGFEINRVASIRPQAHDQRLDWIVTEAGAWRFDRL